MGQNNVQTGGMALSKGSPLHRRGKRNTFNPMPLLCTTCFLKMGPVPPHILPFFRETAG